MITLNRVNNSLDNYDISFILPLTAEQRRRSHQQIELDNQHILYLKLPRGTRLQVGDILQSENESMFVQIEAKPEPVMTVTANSHLELLKSAYHLGNRHIPLEIQENYLRFNHDHVLARMLIQLGLQVKAEICPFYPEIGAYQHNHD
jgi:urease accessory protein